MLQPNKALAPQMISIQEENIRPSLAPPKQVPTPKVLPMVTPVYAAPPQQEESIFALAESATKVVTIDPSNDHNQLPPVP
jgi:hypothetical protein